MPTPQKSRDNSSPENIEDDSMAVFNGEDQVCPYYVRINKKYLYVVVHCFCFADRREQKKEDQIRHYQHCISSGWQVSINH